MKKSVVFLLHFSFWILIGLVSYVIQGLLLLPAAVLGGGSHLGLLESLSFISVSWLISGFIFYVFYFLAPYFLKKIWLLYLVIAFILAIAIAHAFLAKFKWNNSDFLLEIFMTYTPILMFIFLAFLFRSLTEWLKDRKIKAELEKEKVTTQLELLKSKINPHFLFNSLNNIDVLIEESPKIASEYLKKLSDILRYVLYETKDDTIYLAKEIAQIKNYIELQKIRTDNPRFVNFKVNGEMHGQKIGPMIFLSFIENTFKHSKNKNIDNAIEIEFTIDETQVKMVCRNYYESNQLEIIPNEGLGMETIKQRLTLLYPGKHELTIDKKDHWYTVNLTIKLNDDH